MAKGGDDRSLTGITVIHGAYDASIAEGMIPWHRMIQRQGMVAGVVAGVVAGMLGMAGVVPGDGGRE